MAQRQPSGLIRSLGLTDATLLVIGCIVGVGIFRTASTIAKHVPSPALILTLWIAGGLLSLCGALCYAELAAMFPKSGGDYVYITKTYGRFWGFLFGWTKLFVERTGTIAILGFVFAEYLSKVAGYGPLTARWVAALAVGALSLINVLGIRWGKYVQNALTALKIASLCAIVGIGWWAGQGHEPLTTLPADAAALPILQSMGLGLIFVLWTYGGWTEAAYVAEEVKQPQRNVPLAIIGGVLITTVLYVVVNAVYLSYLPIQEMTATPLVASATLQKAIGAGAGVLLSAMVACSAFGALNGYILTGGRILYAIGQDHPIFARLGRLDATFHTPAAAIWLNAAIAVALIFTKTFDQIMTYSTVVIQVFFTMAVIAVIILRRRMPDAPRPYRAWGYPWTPAIYILVMVGFVADVALKEPRESLFGLGCMAVGLPLYWLSQRQRTGPASIDALPAHATRV